MNYFVVVCPDGNFSLRQSESAIYTHASCLTDDEGWGVLGFHKTAKSGLSALKTYINRKVKYGKPAPYVSGVIETQQIDRKTYNDLKSGKITGSDLVIGKVETAL